MTANAMREDQRRCFEAGMDDYISKPFSPATLIETVERWIEESLEPEVPSVAIGSDEAADIPIVDPECLAGLYQFLPAGKVNSLLFFYLIRSDQQIARLARLNRTLTLDEIFHEGASDHRGMPARSVRCRFRRSPPDCRRPVPPATRI